MQGQGLVRVDRIGDVAVLVLCHPPVNALSADLRQALAIAFQQAFSDAEIIAVVLRGDGKGFSAGADIAEFGKATSPHPQAPDLGGLCQLIENAPKPVIAAIHGMALGGGLELALAAHYRVAQASAQLGTPEVKLGLLPGAGGTQRLPRLIGAAEALRLMLTGAPVAAPQALALGLIDRCVEHGLTETALAMANDGLVPRRSCDMRRGMRDMSAYQAAVTAARATTAQAGDTMPAPARIVDLVDAAALLPFAQGLIAEQAAFGDLVATPQAAGLRYAFFTERRASLPPQPVAAKGIAPINILGLWDVGDMTADLAFQALSAGMHVVWAAPDRASLVQALGRTAALQEQAVVAGTITQDIRDADWARLTTGKTALSLTVADLVLTASDAAELTLPDPVLQAAIGVVAAQAGPAIAVTVPMAAGGLAELSLQPNAAPDVVARLMALARRLNWRLAFAGPGGPIELHLRQALALAVDHLGTQGIDPATLAAILAHQGIGTGTPTNTTPTLGPQTVAQVTTTCLAALAAEGARMVQDGRARRPLDVDAVALLGGLMPRWMGGPMFQADQRGLLVLRQDLRQRSATAPVFAPPALLDDLISASQTFASLNGR